MSFLDHIFRRPESVPEPEPTVEESRAARERELRRELDRLNAECKELSGRITEFLFQHKTADGGYRAGSPEELGSLPMREKTLRQREWLLNQERSAVLAKLSKLITNPNESRHVEGRLVDREV